MAILDRNYNGHAIVYVSVSSSCSETQIGGFFQFAVSDQFAIQPELIYTQKGSSLDGTGLFLFVPKNTLLDADDILTASLTSGCGKEKTLLS